MKYFNNFITLVFLCCSITAVAQDRYLEEIFDDVKVTSDIHYATNITIITGSPAPQQLLVDIYEPEGDDITQRPLIIMFHSGNFLPYPINQGTSGTKTDLTVVGMAERLAKMGYVVASAQYRLGWNPAASSQAERVTLLINAAYRGVQDANTSVRFFKKTVAEDGNPYGIDPDRITLWGIGTGGYISLNTTVLDTYEKTLIPKFIGEENGQPSPMVKSSISGDPQGTVTAPINIANHASYSSSYQLSVNLGGAMGDTSWLDPGMIPMISFQVPSDPFAPYTEGIVIVPGLNLPVVEVQGSYLVQQLANAYGNNDVFVEANLDDVYTQAANANNDGYEGLFPFVRSANPLDSSPWDWWDAATNLNHANGILTNPDMSFEKAMIFTDSIIGYFAPRAYVALDLATLISVNETILPDAELKAMPNPAHTEILVATTSAEPIREITMMDINGKVVKSYRNVDNQYFTVHRNELAAGVYMLHARMDKGVITKKIIFQ